MNKTSIFTFAFIMVLTIACKNTQKEPDQKVEDTTTQKEEVLTEGVHAIHIHEKADCSSTDGKSTGGHWNPTAQPHGKWDAVEGYHKGDIGNFTADASGKGSVTFTTDQWCIGCGDETKDILGKAVIVHAGTDDYITQPTGDAGGRVSCAGIIQ
jgi:Cu-Zn family superoxide dismutase